MKITTLKNIIKEEINNTENKDNLSPQITFKIYDVLKDKFPEIGAKYTASSFYHFLKDNIK